MTLDLTEIRARDALADVCKRDGCGLDKGHVVHTETAAECTARKRAEKPPSGACQAPKAHHDYEPGAVLDRSGGDVDRRVLLAEVDRLTGAVRKAARKLLRAIGDEA